MKQDIRNAFWTALDESPFVMMRQGEAGAQSRPMTALLDRGAHHTIWFFLHRGSPLAAEGAAQVDFSSSGHRIFAALTGQLRHESDPAMVERLRSQRVEGWFPGGRSDAQLTMMRFEISQAEVWTADDTLAGLFDLFTGLAIRPRQTSAIRPDRHVLGLL